MELAAGAVTVGSGLAGSRRRVGGARGGGMLDDVRAAPAWRDLEQCGEGGSERSFRQRGGRRCGVKALVQRLGTARRHDMLTS